MCRSAGGVGGWCSGGAAKGVGCAGFYFIKNLTIIIVVVVVVVIDRNAQQTRRVIYHRFVS